MPRLLFLCVLTAWITRRTMRNTVCKTVLQDGCDRQPRTALLPQLLLLLNARCLLVACENKSFAIIFMTRPMVVYILAVIIDLLYYRWLRLLDREYSWRNTSLACRPWLILLFTRWSGGKTWMKRAPLGAHWRTFIDTRQCQDLTGELGSSSS